MRKCLVSLLSLPVVAVVVIFFSPEVTIVVAIGGQGEACADALVTRLQLHARLNMMMIYYMYR